MPETKTRRPAAKRPAANKNASARKARWVRRELEARRAAERSTELSEEVIKSLDDGARSAIDAVRKFADTAGRALPQNGTGPSRREEITDSALEMAQRLLHTHADFRRRVVDSAGRSLTGAKDKK